LASGRNKELMQRVDLPDGAVRILKGKAIAHLGIVRANGEPHVSPIWIDLDDEGLVVFNTAEGRVKANVLREGVKVAISAPDPDNPYSYTIISGTVVKRTTEDGIEVIDQLSQKYTSRDFTMPEDQVRVTVRVRPDEVIFH
jgi:PPOX class probable F420-dependent enzyme